MKKKPLRKRISPKESVEGPEVDARPERTNVSEGTAGVRRRRTQRSKPIFPTGAQLKKKVFQRKRR